MTFRDVYIGSLSDRTNPLDWSGDWKVGNCPPVESPYFPPAPAKDPHGILTSGIISGRFKGEMVDWGGWAARMSKAEVLAFIEEVYGDGTALKEWLPHLHKRFIKLKAFVNALPDDGHYALVANEF